LRGLSALVERGIGERERERDWREREREREREGESERARERESERDLMKAREVGGREGGEKGERGDSTEGRRERSAALICFCEKRLWLYYRHFSFICTLFWHGRPSLPQLLVFTYNPL
jgi:hypothetical protein